MWRFGTGRRIDAAQQLAICLRHYSLSRVTTPSQVLRPILTIASQSGVKTLRTLRVKTKNCYAKVWLKSNQQLTRNVPKTRCRRFETPSRKHSLTSPRTHTLGPCDRLADPRWTSSGCTEAGSHATSGAGAGSFVSCHHCHAVGLSSPCTEGLLRLYGPWGAPARSGSMQRWFRRQRTVHQAFSEPMWLMPDFSSKQLIYFWWTRAVGTISDVLVSSFLMFSDS